MEHSALIILVIIATIYVTSCYALYIPSDEALEADPKYRELVDMDDEDSASKWHFKLLCVEGLSRYSPYIYWTSV